MSALGATVDLRFRFSEGHVTSDLASERGLYQRVLPTKDEQRSGYGRFHTIARKHDGGWRLTVDYSFARASGTRTRSVSTPGRAGTRLKPCSDVGS